MLCDRQVQDNSKTQDTTANEKAIKTHLFEIITLKNKKTDSILSENVFSSYSA